MKLYQTNWGGIAYPIVARDERALNEHLARLRKVADVSVTRVWPLTMATDYNGPIVQGWIKNAKRYGSVTATGLGAIVFN